MSRRFALRLVMASRRFAAWPGSIVTLNPRAPAEPSTARIVNTPGGTVAVPVLGAALTGATATQSALITIVSSAPIDLFTSGRSAGR